MITISSYLNTTDLLLLLNVLVEHPRMYSFIDEDHADELQRLELFDLDIWGVSALGRDYLSENVVKL